MTAPDHFLPSSFYRRCRCSSRSTSVNRVKPPPRKPRNTRKSTVKQRCTLFAPKDGVSKPHGQARRETGGALRAPTFKLRQIGTTKQFFITIITITIVAPRKRSKGGKRTRYNTLKEARGGAEGLLSVPHRPSQDAPQHVPSAFVGRHRSIGDGKRQGSRVIGDNSAHAQKTKHQKRREMFHVW